MFVQIPQVWQNEGKQPKADAPILDRLPYEGTFALRSEIKAVSQPLPSPCLRHSAVPFHPEPTSKWYAQGGDRSLRLIEV
jgi:hypothetical protein